MYVYIPVSIYSCYNPSRPFTIQILTKQYS